MNTENMSPLEILKLLKLKKDETNIKKLFDMNIFKIVDGDIIIPSYRCLITKDNKPKKDYFPFAHQVFYFCLQDLKDLQFALSETKLVLDSGNGYTFPNGTIISLDK